MGYFEEDDDLIFCRNDSEKVVFENILEDKKTKYLSMGLYYGKTWCLFYSKVTVEMFV